MKFKGCKLTLRKRRGLSSVVGALLFVVLMVATFAVLGVALNTQTDIVSTGRDVAEIGLEKQLEDFNTNIFANSTEFLTVNKYYKMPDHKLEYEASKYKIGDYAENIGNITKVSRKRIIEQLLAKDSANNSRYATLISILALLISIISIIITFA